jgi:hypothetical protein
MHSSLSKLLFDKSRCISCLFSFNNSHNYVMQSPFPVFPKLFHDKSRTLIFSFQISSSNNYFPYLFYLIVIIPLLVLFNSNLNIFN